MNKSYFCSDQHLYFEVLWTLVSLFAFRCSLTQRWVLVSLNLPSSSSQQAVPPRHSPAPPGEGLVCCTCRVVGTSAPSHVLHYSLWNIEETVKKWGRAWPLERAQGQGQGQGPAWIILNALTVWSESLERQCFEGKPMVLKYVAKLGEETIII